MARLGSWPTLPEELLADLTATSFTMDTEPANAPAPTDEGERARLSSLLSELKWEAPVGNAVRFATPVAADLPLGDVPDLFLQTTARILVVVDEQHRPLGVVTPLHLLRTVKSTSPEELARLTALDASTSGGAFLPATATLRSAARRLTEEDRDFVLVVGEAGRLVGLICLNDILVAIGRL